MTESNIMNIFQIYISFLSTLLVGIVGSIVLEYYGWKITFQIFGLASLVWVYYFRNYVLIKSRTKLSILSAKDALYSSDDSLPTASSSSISSVPWMELIKNPSFW